MLGRQIIGDGVDEMIKVYDSVDVSHWDWKQEVPFLKFLWQRVSSSKLTQYDALSENWCSDLAKVAMEAKNL